MSRIFDLNSKTLMGATMKKRLQKLALISGATMASLFAVSLPGNASVFYDVQFWGNNGELLGTGEFSHEDEPFEATIDLCLVELSCGSIPLEIKREDRWFRVESFSSTVGLDFSLIERERTDLFWRPFDDNRVASITPCVTAGCIGRELLLVDSWYEGIIRSVATIDEMRATTWRSLLSGSGIPPEAQFDLSGTWTATRRTPAPESVPEPASIFGLMALGALGASSMWKRNRP